jgi:hypothetical protein
MTPHYLQCSFCLYTREWDRASLPEGIGHCGCRKGRFLESVGATQMYRALSEMPSPAKRGGVFVISSQGTQELHGPHYQENPHKWRK